MCTKETGEIPGKPGTSGAIRSLTKQKLGQIYRWPKLLIHSLNYTDSLTTGRSQRPHTARDTDYAKLVQASHRR